MTEQNIVVVGASYSGILCAHYIAKHIVTNKQLGKLRLILISPSSEFFHTVGGPGAIIDGKRLPNEKVFYSLAEGFKQYPSSSYDIVKGTVTAVEISARNIQYSDSGTTKSVPFHGLILATGASATSPLFRAFPTTDDTRAAYKAFRDALPKARSIVIGGGGPVAVESAGEIGEFLNGTAGWFSSRPSSPKAKITLVTSSSKLLPILREDVASRAEKYLNRVGVDVVYNTKVAAVSPNNAGSTLETLVPRNGQKVEVQLHDGETLEADIYIPAYGVKPQAHYLPKELLNESGLIKTNAETLRVDDMGPRIYAIGDGSSASPGGISHIMNMVPVVMSNLKRDIIAAKNGKEKPTTGKDRTFEIDSRASQIVPVGRGKGVGQMMDWWVPSIFVWLIKGRDYLAFMSGNYQYGKLVKKENAWKFES